MCVVLYVRISKSVRGVDAHSGVVHPFAKDRDYCARIRVHAQDEDQQRCILESGGGVLAFRADHEEGAGCMHATEVSQLHHLQG